MRPADLERPRAILFDWDNTLVDTWPTIIECYRATFTAFGSAPWTDQEVRDRAHGSLRDHFPVLFGAEADRAEEVLAALGGLDQAPAQQVGIAQGYPLPALVACACIVVVVIAVNVLGERLFEQAQRTHR